ncbi:hypothetical protein [Terrisporobacter sp.]|uniref:hypothetical protein n=1 Tax=Terrisporobacter sp. TaxID=1965305 RepID=UPI00289898D7|nr:hypothetical protein [Terrisporobacter sp.]
MSRMKFRRKEKKYTEVYNTIIFQTKDMELTGLYTTIQACIDLEINTKGTDKEFVISKKTIQNFCGCGETKFNKNWDALKKAGYLKQYKIKSENGKFEYEYELLDEPDLTTHHSLIVNEDGSLTPNIPKSKIEKLKNTLDEKPGGQNEGVKPGGRFVEGGKYGGYYKDSLGNVCRYVYSTKEHFALTNKDKELIETLEDKMDFDLYEQIIVDAKNKDKTFGYVKGIIKNCLDANITTLDAYIENNKNHVKTTKSKTQTTTNNKPSKTKTEESSNAPANTFKPSFQVKRNSQNCINESFRNYTPVELERLLLESQKDKF